MEGNGTGMFWGGDAALWEELDAALVSGKGSLPPSHPALPFWAGDLMQSMDGKPRHGEGGITVPTFSPCPGFHASHGSSCRCVLPPGTSRTLTHTLMVTAS